LENKKGDNVERRGDKMLRKADTPSNKGKQEGVQWETRGDKTLGKADTPSNKGNQEGVYHHTHHLGLCGGNGNTSSK
jgi:hypothetical protein